MQWSGSKNDSSQKLALTACLLSSVMMVLWITGCGDSKSLGTPPATSQQAPQSYFGSDVAGGPGTVTFIFDDVAKTFSEETLALLPPKQVGPQVFTSGGFTVSQRGLQSLGILTTYAPNSFNQFIPTNYPSPGLPGSFAVELAGQAGGLVQLAGQAVEPLVAATQCPNSTSAQTYQFVTIPLAGGTTPGAWNAATDTAYGSADVASSGSTVHFQNIHQYTLGATAPTDPSDPSVDGACGSTTLGYLTGVPGMYVVTNPGISSAVPPQAGIGIGPTGLLVEDNGAANGGINVLGAGSGAVGLPMPSTSSPLDTSKVIGAQYLGFIYGAGGLDKFGSIAVSWSSHVASFGFPASSQSSCSSFAAETGPLVNGIYGGDFSQNNGQDNPSASPDGYGNCDLAIDLGAAAPSSNNGLYPKATVWVGGSAGNSFVGNARGKTYSFPAVAITGQLNGKYAIFLIGTDSVQPWAIYLLQSN